MGRGNRETEGYGVNWKGRQRNRRLGSLIRKGAQRDRRLGGKLGRRTAKQKFRERNLKRGIER